MSSKKSNTLAEHTKHIKHTKTEKNANLDLEILNIKKVPIILLDYIWVIAIYFFVAFWIEVFIDGYLLPPFILENEQKKPSWLLFIEVFLQIALQGFIVFILHALLQFIPSPVNGIMNYNIHSTIGKFLRNPAIITTMLFLLSNVLRKRMLLLFARYNKNYV
jgi:hypothetical protein